MKVKDVGSKIPLHQIEPLDLGQGWGLFYEGRVGERYCVRLSRHLPGVTVERDLEDLLMELRPWRRRMPDGGIMKVVWWLHRSEATYDALTGAHRVE